MASGSSVDKDIVDEGSSENVSSFETSSSSSRTRTAAANVYTPLLTTPKTTSVQTSTDTSSNKVSTSALPNEPPKSAPIVVKKPSNKSVIEQPNASSRGQRSSVRPFFCCGSELSLVSLVDGLELKESSSCKDKKICSIECNSSSEEEESVSSNSLSAKNSGSSGQIACLEGETRQAVVRRKKKDKHNVKKKFWSIHLRGRWNPRWRMSQPQRSVSHRCDLSLHNRSCSGSYQTRASPGSGRRSPKTRPLSGAAQFIDLTNVHDFDRLYPVDDIDTIRMRERAQEMAAGVDVFPVSLTQAFGPRLGFSESVRNILRHQGRLGTMNSDSSLASPDSPTEDYSLLMNDAVWQWQGSRSSATMDGGLVGSPRIHTQVDFIHCLVPDLVKILGCPFYWGVMDRYEAERLLDSKPEGTFLLRDSAQEDFLFSVSFRRYNRSLHARVEQWNHRFSFDAHDPAVFSAPSVCELMEHYKDPCCCMFFEPMLTRPLPRNYPFSLQHICRAVICDRLSYDQIRVLPLPNSLKQFLQIYHYKQKVRVRHFDGPDLPYGQINENSSNSSGDNMPNFQMLLK